MRDDPHGIAGVEMNTSTFDSKSRNVGDLLSTNTRERVVVPKFQRGYEWTKKHVEAFWNDILQFQRDSGLEGGPDKYFLGPIVILQKSKDLIELLDGQQRLATITILLSVLRDVAATIAIKDAADFARDTQTQLILKEDGQSALQLGETDEAYFKDFIQSEVHTDTKPRVRTHRNIKEARELLHTLVTKEVVGSNPKATLTSLRAMRQMLRSDLVMACIPVASERDAFRIFETLNDRGLRLSVPDLLLNYLMREAKPESDRKEIRNLWTDMIEQMGRRDINRFLRHMWVSKYGDLKAKDLFTALKQHVEQNSVKALDFAKSCATECESYTQLVGMDEEHLGDASKFVRHLLDDLDSQASLPFLLSAFQLLPPADFVKVCQWALIFVVRYSVIAGLDASGLETVFFELARQIRVAMEKGPAGATKCTKLIKDTLSKNAPSDSQIKGAVEGLILSSHQAGYVLGRLAEKMQTSTKEVKIDDANVEHVFPKNPGEKEWGGATNHSKLEPLLWHIGNLTILGRRLNRVAANSEFSIKREQYEKKSELTMAKKIAKDYQKWDEASIKDRAKKLCPLILEVWNFANPSRV